MDRLDGRLRSITVDDAARGSDRLSVHRQDHAVPADDQRPRSAARRRGKQEANVGVSRVPDERLDRLTAMFNPKKHVPATVEFADIGGAAGGRPARRRWSTSRRTERRRAAARRPRVSRSVGAARRRARRSRARRRSDGGRADPRGPRRRRAPARTAREGPEEGAATPSSRRSRTCCCAAATALEDGQPLRALELAGEDAKRLRGFQFLSAKPLLLVINLDEADLAAAPIDAVELAGLQDVRSRAPRRARCRLREDRARDRAARRRRRRGVPGRPRARGVRPRSRDPRQLRPARLHLVLHRRRGRVPRLVDSARHAGAARGRRDPHRHPARLHPRRSRALRAPARARHRWPPAAITASCGSKARNTSSQDGDVINFRHAT